ncbi:TIGR02391 family protein [Acidithrix ferrooxidans]|uniref:Conserved hypothetical protein CHP02391 domain-containing protein n=1 Tax=Acidithrix ferrooxidans TaxID=1280514 RepID=A0A0D8HFC4_9ACTN|nr:TIGR02391 family protein [Acidithrix ferrooxidans]KJF16623.1 hypothetical protein AXFE_24850 [Acidithrix ferrooxidans]
MNTEWALNQLQDFISATEVHHVRAPSGVISVGTYKTAESEVEVVKKAQIVEQILNRAIPGWRSLEVDTRRKKWALHHEVALRAKESLLRQEELQKNLGENAPEISAAKLHPWVWNGASSLWQSGHYRSAVEDAAKKVNAETQNKVGRRDVSEKNLFQEAFSTDAPITGKSRLRRMTNDGSDTYRSVQRGAMALAEGIYSGIRNPFNHEDPKDIDEQVALEYLAALSVLARWVDEAIVEATP